MTSGGSANAQTLTYTVAPAAYVQGQIFTFIVGPGLTNTTSTTLNVNGLGDKTMKRNGANLAGGELQAGQVVVVGYDGTNMQLLAASGGSAFGANLTQGSVLFEGASGVVQDNANFFWDATNHRLGLGTASPSYLLHVNGNASASNWVIQTEATTSAGTVGFTNANGPAIQLYGTASAGAGEIAFLNANVSHMTLSNAGNLAVTGNISTSGQYQVGGVQIAASNLSNGTTGSGLVVLATAPTLSGTVSAGNYVIGSQATTDAGTVGFTNANGPGIVLWGSAAGGAGEIEFKTAGSTHMTLGTTGNLNVTGQYQVGGSQIAASNLSNGTLGSGNVLLASAQSNSSNGYTYIGPILIQWGTSPGFAGGTTSTVTFPIAFPTGAYVVTATIGGASAIAVSAGSTTSTQVVLTASSANSSTASWIAIGH